MIAFLIGNIPVHISFWFSVMMMLMLGRGNEAFTLQCLAASLIHECGHFAMMLAVRDRPCRICFGVFGVRVERHAHSTVGYGAQSLVSFAGPCFNLCCAWLLYRYGGGCDGVWIHVALGVFNLLPVEGLDGGEGLYRLLCIGLGECRAQRVARCLSVATLLPLGVLSFVLLFQSGTNASLLFLTIYLIFLLIFKEKH